jgi:glutamine amidotransferase
MNVALFDYGAGNLHSLGKALEGAGARVRITGDWADCLAADGLVLPGVGAFGAAAAALPGDPTALVQALEAGLPCLGICLGMQLLFDESEESAGRGVGLIPGQVRRLEASIVPQMGWNDVDVSDDPLFRDAGPLVAYYANSFVCEPKDPDDGIAWSDYEGKRFTAAVRRANTWGVQFHPEKSSELGRRLIANWVAMAEEAS